mmetsp:Transcript_70679/g.223277  ORF Transcript_70679/g.223277 Transcript_70679/m.223277 type:complete len:351 (+) Transcript_70679:1-1053(+)
MHALSSPDVECPASQVTRHVTCVTSQVPSFVLLVDGDVDEEGHADQGLLDVFDVVGGGGVVLHALAACLWELHRIHLALRAALRLETRPQIGDGRIVDLFVRRKGLADDEGHTATLPLPPPSPVVVAASALDAAAAHTSVRSHAVDVLVLLVEHVELRDAEECIADVPRCPDLGAVAVLGFEVRQAAAAGDADGAVVAHHYETAAGQGPALFVREQRVPLLPLAFTDLVHGVAETRVAVGAATADVRRLLRDIADHFGRVAGVPIVVVVVEDPVYVWLQTAAAAALAGFLEDHHAVAHIHLLLAGCIGDLADDGHRSLSHDASVEEALCQCPRSRMLQQGGGDACLSQRS